jgi:porphobilinogen deaminase
VVRVGSFTIPVDRRYQDHIPVSLRPFDPALFGMVFNRDGSTWVRSHAWGPTDDPASVGAKVAGDLLHQGARRLIMATKR